MGGRVAPGPPVRGNGLNRAQSLAKLVLLLSSQLPLLQASPILHTAKKQGKSAKDPELWVYASVSLALVVLGGVFAGLTIALMGQVGAPHTSLLRWQLRLTGSPNQLRMRYTSKSSRPRAKKRRRSMPPECWASWRQASTGCWSRCFSPMSSQTRHYRSSWTASSAAAGRPCWAARCSSVRLSTRSQLSHLSPLPPS